MTRTDTVVNRKTRTIVCHGWGRNQEKWALAEAHKHLRSYEWTVDGEYFAEARAFVWSIAEAPRPTPASRAEISRGEIAANYVNR